ncbi:MAG: secondary thiamine-phosphate synthase [gamma proteobacterium symbiont of Ctena orbiculata]|uniref:Secondary thiamine-phosphate synthase enzyme YjbQ n=1 Tax=Candidatus Thiodiazotropha taylori TaxID=2792791 RepID=A0A944MAN9_9GAMM|nr:secondary thiamine-phosphate synthase enzyme YjbQ [Candidatus Thiodiazotropha taylori]PUB87260.1 MAG: secondary thiamine-phosphate synthase [gamma proteobacterium symbiont of Ctena orbiculata]MBT3025763.1 secondary thiamine-phosphate synthase enzyme YjbQ [Candidatus Thiodiazotropha taylori]MBT3033764.1 secondary thiamine-phosphate synthase enzyme YjbQ [Candidatus Thiodiazotropha taylori]MBV2135569.1 secondary thiamine-phosphate synthase enzyme YjbQ [Candidatus Thiodiazotropha taylori]
MVIQEQLQIQTRGRNTYNITNEVAEVVSRCGLKTGICQLFIQHTSASLILCENADPAVRTDLERIMTRLVPDGDPLFDHTLEGPDDMPAHVRSILTHMDLSLPISNGRPALGTWQGIYLWEHRTHPHQRRVMITLYGD